jgi:hypothetical protein
MMRERRERTWRRRRPRLRRLHRLGGERGWLVLRLRLGAARASSTGSSAASGCAAAGATRIELRPGDALDFWRVEAVEPGRLLRLRAEMKVPGRAWLQFEAGAPRCRFAQTAYFAPKGLAGLLYWYALYPLHRRIFSLTAWPRT